MTKKMLAEGGYDFSGTEILNIGAAVAGTSAAQWQQVQALVTAQMSNLDFKGSARVASTGNVSTTTAPATIDGVTLAGGDRILLKDQTSASENGLYTFASAGSALTRAIDADANAEVTPGLWVIVEEGTVNADTAWLLTTNAPITVGTTPLAFAKYSTGGGGTTKHAVTGPATAATTWTITHTLNTTDVVVAVREVATNEMVDVTITVTDATTVTITAATNLAQNAYRAVIIG
ncbi:hypothetical protein SAMN05421505_12078 [Sinosporangium album]|uniref:Uncharacterized protein n=1 Tax=Sinosporangium album TaxID=504805 RepID=A0A1G8EFL8_9ACTN|nr:hypothetical protein [Sinosporangium album]SDH68661.1 hypothetical protein SAMN05421505_12078 [Sinosporangium album]